MEIAAELEKIKSNDRSKFFILGSGTKFYKLIGGISDVAVAELERELQKLNLHRNEDGVPVAVEENGDGFELNLGPQRSIFFSGQSAIQSMALVVCLYFAGYGRLSDLYGKKVSAFTLNLDELIYLQCLRKAINSFTSFDDYDAKPLRRGIKECTKEACYQGPLFSGQAICCENSGGLLAKLTKKRIKSGKLWELANEMLYASKLRSAEAVFEEFAGILDEYCELVKMDYSSQIIDCANKLENQLVFEVPVSCVEKTIVTLSDMIGGNSEAIKKEICDALSENFNSGSAAESEVFKKIDAAFTRLLEEKLTDTYSKAALTKISSKLRDDVDRARKQNHADGVSAMNELHTRLSKMLDASYSNLELEDSLSEYALSWKNIGEFSAEKVMSRHEQWTKGRLAKLISYANNNLIYGTPVNLWLVDTALKDSAFQGQNISHVLYGDSNTIVGIYSV